MFKVFIVLRLRIYRSSTTFLFFPPFFTKKKLKPLETAFIKLITPFCHVYYNEFSLSNVMYAFAIIDNHSF